MNRPEWTPKKAGEVDSSEVHRLTLIGCSLDDVATLLETTPEILERGHMRMIELARAERREQLRASQWRLAIDKGDRSMLIWLGKQDLGQTDRQAITNESEEYEIFIGEAKEVNLHRLPPPESAEVLEEPETS